MNTLRLFTATVSDRQAVSRLESHYFVKQDDPEPTFSETIRALVTFYRRCERDNAPELARRTMRALVALLGPQKHLRDDDNVQAVIEAAEDTLRGLGGGK